MKKPNKLCQLKSKKLWTDSISIGLAIFGVVSAILGVPGVSFNDVFGNVWLVIFATIGTVILSYLIAVTWQWRSVKDSITLKIRGIKVTIRQGDIFESDGFKVIGVDDTFSTSDDDNVISKNSLHGKLIKRLKDSGEIQDFIKAISSDTREVSLGSVKKYKDFLLLVMTKLDKDNEAHTDNQRFESTLRKMWQEICRVYAGKPINIPLLGTGVIRFDGVTDIPTPFSLLKCMLCTLKTSNVQIKAPITIVVYDKLDEINLYDLKGV